MSTPDKHAILSPSGAAGWLVCAGKPAMEQGKPDDSNADSDYGTAAHSVASMCLDTGNDPLAYHGRRIDVGNCKTVEVDSEMVMYVRIYTNAVRDTINRYKLAGAVSVEMMVEQKVPIGHITGEEGAEGTADTILIVTWPDDTVLIHVIDLKFGVGVKVFAEENPQGMLYALGAVKKLEMVADFNRVVVSIHQPRVNEEPSEWELAIDALREFGDKAHKAAKVAWIALKFKDNWMGKPDDQQYLVPGAHCRKTFCKARGTCPALAKFVSSTLGAEFSAVVMDPTSIAPTKLVSAPAGAVINDDLAVKMRATDIIEDWCKAVRGEVESRLLQGTPVPGCKLVEGRLGNRAWSDTTEAEKLLKSFRLKQEQMYNMSVISPTDAEKLAPKYDKDGKLKAKQPDGVIIKDGQWQKLKAVITRAPGKPSVAFEEDPRPALVIKPPVEEFDVVVPGSSLV